MSFPVKANQPAARRSAQRPGPNVHRSGNFPPPRLVQPKVTAAADFPARLPVVCFAAKGRYPKMPDNSPAPPASDSPDRAGASQGKPRGPNAAVRLPAPKQILDPAPIDLHDWWGGPASIAQNATRRRAALAAALRAPRWFYGDTATFRVGMYDRLPDTTGKRQMEGGTRLTTARPLTAPASRSSPSSTTTPARSSAASIQSAPRPRRVSNTSSSTAAATPPRSTSSAPMQTTSPISSPNPTAASTPR